MANATFKHLLSLLLAGVAIVTAAYAQDPFTWQQKTIGGGGFCMEIRFAPAGFFGLPNARTLYLATDVSGVYRSIGMDADGEVNNWEWLWDANPPTEQDALTLYATTIAFTDKFNAIPGNSRLISGSQEGIFIWDEATRKWSAPAPMPDRAFLASKGVTMDSSDGRYPWIGIIRECPPNTKYLCAGIGNIRNKNFGLSVVLRSINGGNNWELVKIDGAGTNEIVYDIDYIMLGTGADYTFITTNGGIYYSPDMFSASSGDAVTFQKISGTSAQGPLTDLCGLVVLGDSSAMVTSDTLFLFASWSSPDTAKGGVYKATTSISRLNSGVYPNWQKMKHFDQNLKKNLGRIATKSSSNIFQHELFVGKFNHPFLIVATNSDPVWRQIYKVPPDSNNADNGYRVDKKDLLFGSFDFNPADTKLHPDIYACWSYGPFIAKGNNVSHTQMRKVEQMFTTWSGSMESGVKIYQSRGNLDEVFFDGCLVTFDPTNPNLMMVGCGDNGILRSIDGGQTWSHRRLRPKIEWSADYGVGLQTVYHIAYHPLYPNIVLASAGTDNNDLGITGKGELLKNTNGGAGDENSWEPIAGGKTNRNGLPNGEIQGFTFDTKAGFKDGLFVAVRDTGIYYAKVNSNGDIVNDFVRIIDPQLIAKIPNKKGGHHNYSRMMFYRYDPDYLYVARHWPAGGVFRITLKANRDSLALGGGIEKVEEIIIGRMDQLGNVRDFSKNQATEVISLLITPTHVFAGVTPGHRRDTTPPIDHHVGGLVRYAKGDDPLAPNFRNTWVIGGPLDEAPAFGSPSPTIAIGGIAQDPSDQATILAMTYRFTLKEDNNSDPNYPPGATTKIRYEGEANYKFMNLWRSTDFGASFAPIGSSQMAFPNAQTMAFAFFPNPPHDLDRLIVPTHGNGIWIGEKPHIPVLALPRENAAPDSTEGNEKLPKQFAFIPTIRILSIPRRSSSTIYPKPCK